MRQTDSVRHEKGLLVFVAAAVAMFAAAVSSVRPATTTAQPQPPPMRDACLSDNPYFATSMYSRGEMFDREPSVVAFHDTPNNSDHYNLATVGEVGATYGLAYDPARDVLYIGAYLKRASKFGPLGTGGVYEVKVNGGGVKNFLTVPNAGLGHHDSEGNYEPDNTSRGYIGKTSLGDLDLSPDGKILFVMNLYDKKIYRFSVPQGKLLGSFASGGESQAWKRDARPFALAVKDGWLYHGVINSAERSQMTSNLTGVIFASKYDGTGMREVARVWLGYDRGDNHDNWLPWPTSDDFATFDRQHPHPMLTDIEFDDAGNMIVGLRDRYMDTGPGLNEGFRKTPGDILRLLETDNLQWEFDYKGGEFYAEDSLPPLYDEIGMGGLARFVHKDVLVTTVQEPFRTYSFRGRHQGSASAGAMWLDNITGQDLGREELLWNARRHEGPQGKAIGLGDLELICLVPPTPTPGPSPTATPTDTPEDTETPTPTETPDSPPTTFWKATPSLTPTPAIYRIYLPFASHEKACIPDAYHTDVVLVLDRSTSMLRPVEEGGIPKNEAAIEAAKSFVSLLDYAPDILNRHDQIAIVGFNDLAWIETDLTNDPSAAIAALERIRTKTQEGTRLDLAFERGQEPLSGPKHKKENRPVMIVLTDGIPNRVPFPPGGKQEDTVLARAYAARELGTRVYTIGLGKPRDLFPKLMIQAASERSFYYYAPRPEDLAGIYAQIAATFLDCNPHPVPKVTPCVSEDSYIDVVLVLDMSTSMYRETRNGRSKQAAAIEAAHLFVGDLDLEPDGWGRQDQVAIVGFNDTAWVQMKLTDDKVAVDNAIDQLPLKSAEGTRLDLGFNRGQEALDTDKRNPENRAVMVFLTDGLPNRVPFPPGGRQEDTVLEAARGVKDAGTRLFTIGLGAPEDIEGWLLEGCATDKSMYYYAPDGEDLAAIYHQIAGRVVECPR